MPQRCCRVPAGLLRRCCREELYGCCWDVLHGCCSGGAAGLLHKCWQQSGRDPSADNAGSVRREQAGGGLLHRSMCCMFSVGIDLARQLEGLAGFLCFQGEGVWCLLDYVAGEQSAGSSQGSWRTLLVNHREDAIQPMRLCWFFG